MAVLLAALLGGGAERARATDDLPGVNLQDGTGEDDAAPADAESAKTSFARDNTVHCKDAPLDGKVIGPDGKPVDQFSKPDETPSTGTGLYDRMGLRLPDLPAEKPFKGKFDEAYGAFQRGITLPRLDKALPRAQLGRPCRTNADIRASGPRHGRQADIQKALFWYSKAADGGDPSAMFRYALILMEGRLVKQDKARADELMHKAQMPETRWPPSTGAQISSRRSPARNVLRNALPYYEKSAEKGIADAEYALSQNLTEPARSAEGKARQRQGLAVARRQGRL